MGTEFRGRGDEVRNLRAIAALAVVLVALLAASAPAAAEGALAWGQNLYRQLGDGNELAYSDSPELVNGLSSTATAVAAGGRHSLALLSNGTVVAWGDNESGQLGDESFALSDVPVAVKGLSGVSAVAAGANFSLALLSNGTVEAWGEGEHGELGDGVDKESDVPVAVKGLTGVKAIAAGGEQALALLSNGTVEAWGNNEFGQLGTASTKSSDVPVAVHSLSSVIAVAAGASFSLALLKGGTVEAWGEDNSDQLGDSTLFDEEEAPEFSDVPVAVTGLSGVSAISAGATHSLARLSNGTVEAWGGNADGELGIGSSGGPMQPTLISGLSGVSAVAAGAHHSMALLSSGAVMTWGQDEWGQLGDGAVGSPSDAPVAVSGLAEVTAISAGGAHDLALGAPIAAVTGIAPSSGSSAGGTVVKLTGLNFTGATAVKFGSVAAASFDVESATSMTAVAPAGSGVVAITVTTPAGTSSGGAASRFTYVPAPAVKKLAPKSGSAEGGTPVTITGSGFTGASEVRFGAAAAGDVDVVSATEITAVAPPGTVGDAYVTVTTPVGASAPSKQFDYLPAIARISPDAGPAAGGTVVTVEGVGFAPGATTFKFGAVKAKVASCESATVCTVTAPAHAAGTVEVTAKAGKAKVVSSAQFTYE